MVPTDNLSLYVKEIIKNVHYYVKRENMRTFRKFFIVAGRVEVCLRLLPVQFETEGNGQN